MTAASVISLDCLSLSSLSFLKAYSIASAVILLTVSSSIVVGWKLKRLVAEVGEGLGDGDLDLEMARTSC